MSTTNTQAFVVRVISETMEVEPDEFTMQTDLLEELDADSLMILEVVARIETEFGFRIEETQIPEMTSGDAICNIVMQTQKLAA